MNRFVFLWFGLVIILVFGVVSIYSHELVHVEINRFYGFESEIVFYDGTIATIARGNFDDVDSGFFELHALNEIVGYNVRPMFFGLMFLILFCVYYLKDDKKRVGGLSDL